MALPPRAKRRVIRIYGYGFDQPHAYLNLPITAEGPPYPAVLDSFEHGVFVQLGGS